MAEQAGFFVAHVGVHEEELFGDVVEVGGLLEGGGVGGAEGLGHVGAVEPHLVGVDLLVPVAARGGARLDGELVFEEPGGLGVLFLLGNAVDEQRGAAHLDVVEGVAGGFVGGDGAVGGDVLVDGGLDVGEVVAVSGGVPLGGDAIEQRAFLVGPLVVGGDGPLLEDGDGHLLGGGSGGRLGGGNCGGQSDGQACCKIFNQLHDFDPLAS